MNAAQEAARLLAHNTRHEREWETYEGSMWGAFGFCAAPYCDYEAAPYYDDRKCSDVFCTAHQAVGIWFGEAYDEDHPRNRDDRWWHEQHSVPEAQASQAVNILIVADHTEAPSERIYQQALIAIKALRRLPFDGVSGCGGTWRDHLEYAIDMAMRNRC